jgi:hypothetical protein
MRRHVLKGKLGRTMALGSATRPKREIGERTSQVEQLLSELIEIHDAAGKHAAAPFGSKS